MTKKLIVDMYAGTKFGAMLDQLTDRCGTAVLMMMLAVFYPSYAFFFQISMATDISMHWLHLHTYVWREIKLRKFGGFVFTFFVVIMYRSLLQGKGSHKTMSTEEPYLLQIYYTSKPVLFTMCAGNELFYITMYLVNFYDSCK